MERRSVGSYLASPILVENDGVVVMVPEEPPFLTTQDRIERIALRIGGGHDVDSVDS
jgi:hypothetical protein